MKIDTKIVSSYEIFREFCTKVQTKKINIFHDFGGKIDIEVMHRKVRILSKINEFRRVYQVFGFVIKARFSLSFETCLWEKLASYKIPAE